MSHEYDAAKHPCDPLYCNPECSNITGPAGNTTLINGNEKGIMETHLFETIHTLKPAELGSDHDSHKQGIYTTNSAGDDD